MADLSILACYAHPDDEQGISGLLRMCVENNIRTALLCATRGEVGEISDPSLATPETLGEVREQELRTAMNMVGVKDVRFLDYRDSGMMGTAENKDSRAFINADDYEAVGRIVKVMRDFRPTIVVTFDETGGYGHPDHLAIYKWTTQAFHAAGDASQYSEAGAAYQPKRLYYSSFPRSFRKQMNEMMEKMGIESVFSKIPADKFGLADELITNRVNVENYFDLKIKAWEAHRTQNNPNSPFAKMPLEMLRKLRSTENFAYGAGEPIPAGSDPSDVFAGLR